MEQIYKKANAKINLNLEIIGKREDNYHNISSIFQKISLYDELYIKKTKTDQLEIKTNRQELNNKENIIYKAYMLLKERYKNIKGVEVTLNKKIPMQAGLAGGSTDCASFIEGMNQLFNLKLSQTEKESIGKTLGADVVPCFYEGAIKAEGIGELITPIKTNIKYYIVIIKPEISCSTGKLYQKIDEKGIKEQPGNSDRIKQALEQNEIEKIGGLLYNVFEEVVEEKENIQKIKTELIEQGAIGSSMTGSGSCVFGIFKTKEVAQMAYHRLKAKYQTYLCRSYYSRKRGIKDDRK